MKISKYQIIPIIILTFFAVTILRLLFWPYMWEGEYLNRWASIVAIISLIGIPVAYFSKLDEKGKEKKQKEIDERNRASRNLFEELRDAGRRIKE